LLTAEQLRQVLGAVDDDLRFMVLIMFGVGLRVSETLGLKWCDVDLDNGVLHVRRRWYRGDLSDDGETTTDNSFRTPQLGPLVQEFRRRYAGDHARDRFIFVGDDGVMPPWDSNLLRERFRPVLKRLKLYYPGFGWHAFRRQNTT
jgi:integrase